MPRWARVGVVTDPGVLAAHEVDWTGRFRGRALALVRPESTAKVGQAVRVCAAAGVAVVPQGGNTGLVGGAVPHDAVVLSTARLSSIGDVDPVAGALTTGAGVTLERLQRAAAGAGIAFGVDLAARGSATVGGMIATDAGGIHALRHGSMRRQVAGIEAVLADGTVVRQKAGGTAPVGVDLVSLLSGSEGTLAVITGARLRLVPIHPERATALIAFDDVAAAVVATAYARARLPDLDAVELVDGASLALAASRVVSPSRSTGRVRRSSLRRRRPGRRWTTSPLRCRPCPGCATLSLPRTAREGAGCGRCARA